MKKLRNYLDRVRPHFQKGGKLEKLNSVFEGLETFLYVPNKTSVAGVHIHDAVDSKRSMVMVVIALIPSMLFGMFNVGFQHYLSIGQEVGLFDKFLYGFLAVFPTLLVAYIVGLGIEFIVAQLRGHEIQEGFLVTGFLIPLILPVNTPLWTVAIATAFAVIFAKEVFGGTGMNIFNVALVTRAFLFFAYPVFMSGDQVWVKTNEVFGLGSGVPLDAYSGATVLGQLATSTTENSVVNDILGTSVGFVDGFIGLIPGSVGETSVIAILLGAFLLLITGVASWQVMFSVFFGGALMALGFNVWGPDTAVANFPWYNHLVYGGFAFGAVFMATDPVTGARTEIGKYIYGVLVGFFAIFIRVLNPGYPEGMMLAILLMNIFAPLIDYFVVEANVKKRLNRALVKK